MAGQRGMNEMYISMDNTVAWVLGHLSTDGMGAVSYAMRFVGVVKWPSLALKGMGTNTEGCEVGNWAEGYWSRQRSGSWVENLGRRMGV